MSTRKSVALGVVIFFAVLFLLLQEYWLSLIPLAIWLIVSLANTINPDMVGLRRWFGHLERGEEPLTSDNGFFGIGTGLHFTPWFWGIKLIRIPRKKFQFTYQGDPDMDSWKISGTQLAVRSNDRQKLGVDMTVFLSFPWEIVDRLILIIESGVPYDDDEKLRIWMENGFSTDLTFVFGQYGFKDVMGGQKNDELSEEITHRMQDTEGFFARCGIFDDNEETENVPGTGEAYIRIEYVHVSGPLGKALEQVETLKLESEAAHSTAEIKAKVIGRVIGLMLDEWVDGALKRKGFDPEEWLQREVEKTTTITDPVALSTMKEAIKRSPDYEEVLKATKKERDTIVESPEYKAAEKAFRKLRSQELAGEGYTQQVVDINSGGEPLKDSNLAAVLAAFGGAAAIIKGVGDSGGGPRSAQGGGRGSRGGVTGRTAEDELIDEEIKRLKEEGK